MPSAGGARVDRAQACLTSKFLATHCVAKPFEATICVGIANCKAMVSLDTRDFVPLSAKLASVIVGGVALWELHMRPLSRRRRTLAEYSPGQAGLGLS